MGRKHFRLVAKLLVVSLLYFASARFGLTLNAVSGFATFVWAPTGIAIATLFLLGYRFWPAITLAAFVINLVTGALPLVALGIAAGNTLEAVSATYLLKHVRINPKLERVRDVFGVVFLGAALSTTFSATVGVTSLWLSGTVSSGRYGTTWFAWWVGDALGAVVVAPLILVWSQHLHPKLQMKALAETATYFLILAGICGVVFRGVPSLHLEPFNFVYLIFPILIWIALRFGQAGSVAATFVASAIAIWGTVTSSHVSEAALSHKLLLLQTFMGITAITFLVLAAIVAEKEQTQQQEQLLAHKARLLTRQRTQLLALNKAKDEFIALASHQLRTPATIVKVYAGMLLDGYVGRLTKAQKQYLETALMNNDRQLELIDVFLRVAVLDSGKVTLKKERVDLGLFIGEVIDLMAGHITARKQTIRFQQGKGVFAANVDKAQLRIVLENILDNASKYSPSGKEIGIRLGRRGNYIAIAIRDSGAGIPKKDLPKLFKKFSRIDSSLTRSVSGTGLGLYWARKIVVLHRGSITATSSPGKGATFTVLLPGLVGRKVAEATRGD